MVKTIALGRLPKPGGGGLKLQIGSLVTTASVGTPGSFPLLITTVRHLETRTVNYDINTILQALPMGSTKTKYGFVKVVRMGSIHTNRAGTSAVPLTFLALGE